MSNTTKTLRNREGDRARFPDPAFNRWLDEPVTENGEFTVWNLIGDTCDAWKGWENSRFYAAAPDAPAPTDSAEPVTPEMLRAGRLTKAGRFVCSGVPGGYELLTDLYLAMRSAAPPALAVEPQWRPIETAPNDGKRVLVWIADRNYTGTAFATLWFYGDDNSSLGGGAEGFNGDGWRITHWMPLPSAPKEGGAE